MNLSYKDKIDYIERYVDQETVFQYAGFNTRSKNPRNPFRPDKHAGSCNWRWYKNKLYFFDFTYPFENGTKKHITIYGAIMLAIPYVNTFQEAVDFIFEKFVNNYDIIEMQQQEQIIQQKNKKLEEEFQSKYHIIIKKQESWPTINYFSRYQLNNTILNKENVFNVKQYQVIKNYGTKEERDVTHAFPTLHEADNLIVAYKYKDGWKLYFPRLQKGLKKPRFFGNINAKKTVEGYDQIFKPKHKKMLCLGSKKDYMVTRYVLKLDADVYATQNEGTSLPYMFHEKILKTYPLRWLLYDNDEAGIKLANKIMIEDNYTGMLILPQILHNFKLLKDPSDLIEIYPKDTLNIIKQSKIILNDTKTTNSYIKSTPGTL